MYSHFQLKEKGGWDPGTCLVSSVICHEILSLKVTPDLKNNTWFLLSQPLCIIQWQMAWTFLQCSFILHHMAMEYKVGTLFCKPMKNLHLPERQ